MPVVIVFGIPNVKPVAAVDTGPLLVPKANPPVSGLDANAVVAVVVVEIVVPLTLKFSAANPVGAVVVVAVGVIPVLVVVPVLKVKLGVCEGAVFGGVATDVPKLKPLGWAGVLVNPVPKTLLGLFCVGVDVSEKPVDFAASPAPPTPKVKATRKINVTK